MKPMTAQQLTSICRVFTDGDNIPPTCQIQDLIDSGCLADLRDANFRRFDDPKEFRNRIREVCGLLPIDSKGQIEHTINYNDKPFVPDNWEVERHDLVTWGGGRVRLTREGDNLYLDGKKIEFYLSPSQVEGKSIKGDKLNKELENKCVLNACVLDYLRKHPELIPESWKVDERGRTRRISFWGTMYRDSKGNLDARFLYWYLDRWDWGNRWLAYEWDVTCPAAVLAS
jgi:hypothetical protein